ncbi:MAG: ABC transporter permease [Bacteroidetes bacterium]|nr:ABC transporter permease [Bacteroidota bacterium]
MFHNYLKIAVRNINRYTSYTLINVLGLALGISCALIIFSVVKHHLTFDNFHPNSDRIYRFVTEQHRDQTSYQSSVPNPLGKVFREDYTFGEKVARICTFDELVITFELKGKEKKFKEAEVAFVESEFFDIFNYPLSQGNSQTALTEPNTAIITEKIAQKYFGDESAIGKLFRLDKIEFKVTGILKDFSKNTDRRTEIYFSYSTLKDYNEWFASDDSWGGISSQMQCFVRLKPGITSSEVEQVLPAYVKKYRPTSKNVHHYKLQPLNDIHFNAQYGGVMEKRNLWVLSCIGFFLLITACVNFINLATAQAVNRSKEVGIRKVLGSVRRQLFWQFILETGIITLLAMVIAYTISHSALPYVSEWFTSPISTDVLFEWPLMLFMLLLFFLVTLVSGSYPGLILAGFKPVAALKGKLSHQHTGGFKIRRALIITQFSISQVLMIALIVIIYQMHYAKQSDLGFNKDAIVMVPIGSHDEKMNTLKHQLSGISGVEKISLCFTAPSASWSWSTSLRYENRAEEEGFSINFKGGDEHYLSTFDLGLVAGRNLLPSDTAREFLVNETFVKKLNLQSPDDILGTTIISGGGRMRGPVVGVVKDFHDQSFHQKINPIFISTVNDQYNYYALKVSSSNLQNTLAALEKSWSQMYPEKVYEYTFLDDQIAEFYETEDTVLKLIQAFSFIAILIGCMGLYGLVSFMAAQKTKEIGIRKVLGGSVSQILWIFGKEFSGLIIISFLLAAPASWWLMNGWLQNFQYRIDIGAWIFIIAISITFTIALLTVGFQSFKAALMNPVNSLKTE